MVRRYEITCSNGDVVHRVARSRREAAALHARAANSQATVRPEYSDTYWTAYVNGRPGETFRVVEVVNG